jgi:hypothetical protein
MPNDPSSGCRETSLGANESTKMKVYRIEVMVVDMDQIGEQEVKDVIENTRYPNRCISPEVKKIESRDIGEWHDDHPMNLNSSRDAEYQRLFAPNAEVSDRAGDAGGA